MDHLLERKERQVLHDRPDNKPITILLAPTWGSSGILAKYGSGFISRLIATGFDITIRPHPQSFISELEMIRHLMEEFPEDDLLHWNTDADNFDVLSRSDLLISDFSGSIYDYSFIFERPVLYTELNMDMSEKDEAWLDEPYFGLELIPRLGRELKEEAFDELKQMITGLINDTEYRSSIAAAREEYWKNRGIASVLVTDYLLEKLNDKKIVDGQKNR